MSRSRARGFLSAAWLCLLAGCSDSTSSDAVNFVPTEPIARRGLAQCSPETLEGCITVNDGAPAETRYTLFNVVGPDATGMVLVDGLGRYLNSWASNGGDGAPLPEPGTVLVGIEYPGDEGLAGLLDFRTPCMAILGWEGEVSWPNEAPAGAECGNGIDPLEYGVQGEEGRPSALTHHDQQIWNSPVYWTPEVPRSRGDGRILLLAHAELSPQQAAAVTGDEAVDAGDESIVEMAADGKTVLWEWIGADHIDEMGFDEDARAAIRAFVRGQVPTGLPAPPNQGWLLVNAASYLGPNRHCPDPEGAGCDHRFHPDNVLINSRQAAMAFIVSRHGHPDGRWSEGAVVWRLGPDYEGTSHGPVSGQHHAHMIPTGLPGEGNILIFDNGSPSGFGRDAAGELTGILYNRGYSRVVEIDPATGALVWVYEQPKEDASGTPRFYSLNLSSAQRLENGNTFINEGNVGRLFEVTPQGEIVWEFVSPHEPLFTIPLPIGDLRVGIYRAYRVPPGWVPQG